MTTAFSATYSRMAAMVELQATCPYRPRYRAGGRARTNSVREGKHGKPVTINTLTCDRDLARLHKLHGTAQPSLALENLQKAERLGGSEKVKAEKTIRETLGSLYAGQ